MIIATLKDLKSAPPRLVFLRIKILPLIFFFDAQNKFYTWSHL